MLRAKKESFFFWVGALSVWSIFEVLATRFKNFSNKEFVLAVEKYSWFFFMTIIFITVYFTIMRLFKTGTSTKLRKFLILRYFVQFVVNFAWYVDAGYSATFEQRT